MGIGLGLNLTAWGQVVVRAAAVAAPVSVVRLHLAVYHAKGRFGIPERSWHVELAMHIGAALTLFYTFTGFLLSGLGLAWVAVGIQSGASIALVLGSCLALLLALYLVPYSIELMWK